jgi:transcription elongation factor Elf1
MGQQKRNRAQEQRQAFRDRVKTLRCPHCDVEFSDAALDWAEAWLEGRSDLMQEDGWQERDGPYKLCCELCGQRSWLNYFAWTVECAEGPER